jgi:K(+)-stimulated pyrophosphate-energized sodium pump
MIKVINLVSLLAAPVLIAYQKPGQTSVGMFITGAICLAIIVGAIAYSKNGGFKKTPFES